MATRQAFGADVRLPISTVIDIKFLDVQTFTLASAPGRPVLPDFEI